MTTRSPINVESAERFELKKATTHNNVIANYGGIVFNYGWHAPK